MEIATCCTRDRGPEKRIMYVYIRGVKSGLDLLQV